MHKKNLLFMMLLLVLSVAAFLFFTLMNRRPPRIEELNVLLSEPGDRIVITGRRFGENRSLSDVYFDDRQLNLSYIEEWGDDSIVVLVPPFDNSSLVTVETEHGVSNPVVLYNKNDFPRFSLEPFLPELPYIEFIDPSEGGSGTLVTVRGTNFGNNRRGSRIIVNGKSDNHLAFFDKPDEKDFITLPGENYISWNMNAISFYIPEGVESGFLYITTSKGFSNPIYFDVTQRGAVTTLTNPIRYQFLQNLFLDQIGAWEGNTLFLWLPLPAQSARQQNVSLISENYPPYLNRENLSLYRYDELESGDELTLERQFILDLYDYQVLCQSDQIPINYDRNRQLYRKYTAETDEYPLSNRTLKNRASYASGGYRNPYQKAFAIYSFLMGRLTWQEEKIEGSPLNVIDGKKGNTEDYARSLVALMRSSGIPARVVTGLLLGEGDDLAMIHHWVEIYFERVGWFPIDPALADSNGMEWNGEEERTFFWGGLTNRHLAFSRGELESESLDDNGSSEKNNSLYSQQSIHEEKKGNLSFYRSRWPLPRIVNRTELLIE